MKKRVRFLSILLCLTLFVGAIPSTALDGTAETAFADEIANVAAQKPTWEDVYAGAADPRDMYDPLDPDTVPEAIGYETAYARYHVERLYDEEPDLNTVVFLNADQTRTVYLFDYPVKYVDADGTVRDIRLSVQSDASAFGAFQSSPNRMQTQFSRNLTDGIQLSDGTVSIQMIPMAARPSMNRYQAQAAPASLLEESKAKKLDEKTVSYAYDKKTTLEYTPTYTGFKEDIVVSEYTGQTTYDFRLLTNGLVPEERQGSYYLVDAAGTIRANIGDILIFTADERNNTMGRISIRTVAERQEYVMTIHVDPDWLQDEKTAYPIRIDPTIEVSTGTGAIQDVTINSLQGSDGSSGSLFVGKRETYGISRTLMKFPGLNLSTVENASRIQSAVVEMRDVLCEGEELTVSCYVFTGNTWSESTAEWSNVNPNSYTTLMSEFDICYANGVKQATAHRYPFDITDAVQGWKAGNFDPNKGILFKANSLVENGSTYIKKTFSSYNRSSGKPSLTVTYTTSGAQTLSDDTYYLNNMETGKYLHYASSTATAASGMLSSLGNSIRWEVRQVDGGYAIRSASDSTKYLSVSSNPSITTVGVTTVQNAMVPSTCKWKITPVGGLLLKSAYNNAYLYLDGTTLKTSTTLGAEGTSTYNSRVWRCASVSYYGNTSSHSARELSSFSVDTLILNVGESKAPTIHANLSNVLWADAGDFTYMYSSGTSDFISFSLTSGNATSLGTGIAYYTATHKITGRSYLFKIYVDRYTYELTNEFGFEDDVALLIRDCYARAAAIFPNNGTMVVAWRYARSLGEICYNGIDWNDVAGQIVSSTSTTKEYFVSVLGFSESEYDTLAKEIQRQHYHSSRKPSEKDPSIYDNKSDFAHMQITMAARLAYQLNLDGYFANMLLKTDETISYLAGWLGDATLRDTGTVSFGDDDYRADLDAENIYRLIANGESYITATNYYYNNLSDDNNRADCFLKNIDYSTVYSTVLKELGLLYADNPLREIQFSYPPTYNFLMSLKYRHHHIWDFLGG